MASHLNGGSDADAIVTKRILDDKEASVLVAAHPEGRASVACPVGVIHGMGSQTHCGA